MLKDKMYDQKVVKPCGYEYVAIRNKNKLAVTFLNINYKKTSLHCHPSKKPDYFIKWESKNSIRTLAKILL